MNVHSFMLVPPEYFISEFAIKQFLLLYPRAFPTNDVSFAQALVFPYRIIFWYTDIAGNNVYEALNVCEIKGHVQAFFQRLTDARDN